MPWGHNDLTKSASAQAWPVGATAIWSYVTGWNQQEHVVYVDAWVDDCILKGQCRICPQSSTAPARAANPP